MKWKGKGGRRLQEWLTSIPCATTAGIAGIVVIMVEIMLFLHLVYPLRFLQWYTLIQGLGDSALLMLPYWFLKRKWRWAVMAPIWLIPLFLEANLLYFRAFNGLLPFSSVVIWDNYNSLLFDAAISLLRPIDLIFMILPLGYTIWFAIKRRAITCGASLSRKWKMIIAFLTLLLWGGEQYHHTYRLSNAMKKWDLERPVSQVIEAKFIYTHNPLKYFYQNGVTLYLIKSTIDFVTTPRGNIEYTQQQLNEINSFLDNNKSTPRIPTLHGNSDKNLIIIIVESLNADVLHKEIGGRELTPTLNRLASLEGTIVAPHVIAQVADGNSIDGVLIYNTGLLPLSSGVAAQIYGENHYPGLARILSNRPTAEIICEEASEWNHRNFSKAMGYKQIMDRRDILSAGYDIDTMGADVAMLEFGAEWMANLPQPFMVELTTLSMHRPFREDATRNALPSSSLAGIDPTRADYYNSVSYFDNALGRFLEHLKEEGIYQNSVIIIASDHNCGLTPEEYDHAYYDKPGEILFMALNTGHTETVERTVGQIDIYPTILDIMGVETTSWRGVGRSILNSDVTAAADRNGIVHGTTSAESTERLLKAREISDLMIRGNYFTSPQRVAR